MRTGEAGVVEVGVGVGVEDEAAGTRKWLLSLAYLLFVGDSCVGVEEFGVLVVVVVINLREKKEKIPLEAGREAKSEGRPMRSAGA